MLTPAVLLAAAVLSGAVPVQSGLVATDHAELALPPRQPARASARYFHGQTFVFWREVPGLDGEHYKVYRHDEPIDAANLDDAALLLEVAEGSSAFWTDYWRASNGVCAPRFSATLPVPPRSGVGNAGAPAAADEGLLVWTLRAEDFQDSAGPHYYAVTTVSANGAENRTSFGGNATGPIAEAVESPRPLLLEETVGSDSIVRRVYVQYMDLRDWNATLSAPNAVYMDWGQDLESPALQGALQYAYSYVVLEPLADAGDYPLPVVLRLHAYSFERILPAEGFTEIASGVNSSLRYDWPAIEIRPMDAGSTWWFGFAEKGFDYRLYEDDCEAIEALATEEPAIVNYTEQRLLRMVDDLVNDEDFTGLVDPDRVYVTGFSMGGTGALALALRYPNVFAGAYSSVPVTDFEHIVDPSETCPNPSLGWPGDTLCFLGLQLDLAFDAALKWGPPGSGADPFTHVYPWKCAFANAPATSLPVRSEGPFAAHLAQDDGTPVYEWQNLAQRVAELGPEGAAPLVVRHSSIDRISNWEFQGEPMYAALNAAVIPWSGLVDDVLDHKPWWYVGMPTNLALVTGEGPFAGYTATLAETVPGMRLIEDALSGWVLPPPSLGIHAYNLETLLPSAGTAIEWSSSWDPWDGAPIDRAGQWGVSLRVVAGSDQRVDVAPRRTQSFQVTPSATYGWWTETLAGVELDCGCVDADANGVLVIPDVLVGAQGIRVRVEPGPLASCANCTQ